MYTRETELFHHGVKGMKWGVRKSRELYDKAVGLKRKKNKRDYVKDRINDALNPTGNPSDRHKKQKEAKKQYKNNDTKLAWKQSKNKAKMDPSYKNSDEYKKIKQEHTKVVVKELLRDIGNTTTKRM